MYRQAAELPVCSTGITLLRKIYVRTVCQSSTPQQHPPASVSEPQVHSGSKDAKQLEFIAVSSDHKTLHQLTDCSSTWTGLLSCQSDEHLSVVCFTFTLFTFCFVFILA